MELSNYSFDSIAQVVVESALCQEDQDASDRVSLASKAALTFKEELERRLTGEDSEEEEEEDEEEQETPETEAAIESENDQKLNEEDMANEPLTLKVQITDCSEGSRWTRIACGDCGMGWAMLSLEWSILTEDGTVLVGPKAEECRNSGAIEMDHDGERSLVLQMAKTQGPVQVLAKVKDAFGEKGRNSEQN